MTGARVVDGDEDEDEQGVETNLGRSKLRAAAEGSFLALLNMLVYSSIQVCLTVMPGTGVRRGAGGPWTKILMSGHWIRI